MSAPLTTSEITAATTAFMGLLGTLNHRMRLNRTTIRTEVVQEAERGGRAAVGRVAARVEQWAESKASATPTAPVGGAPAVAVPPLVAADPVAPTSAMPGAQ